MKLIIDIPEDMFEWFKNGEIVDEYDKSALKQVFKNGTPLDDVKAEIEEEYNRLSATRADETLELGECLGLKMALKILDNIGKADMRGE